MVAALTTAKYNAASGRWFLSDPHSSPATLSALILRGLVEPAPRPAGRTVYLLTEDGATVRAALAR
jgi:hypothetical protein